jgi:hypothetical protein
VFCHNKDVGLKAIIAIHNTVLGPALGGTRMWPYKSEAEALNDVLRLSRGMTYKNAVAGLNLGGGKAVIIGNPETNKSEALLRALGRYINSLGGRFIVSEDVGTNVEDMELIRQAVAVQRAAGIFTTASAGNSGTGCGTVQDPPAMHDESFSVAALNCPGNVCSDALATFSSRGPVTVDASNRVKPDIAAPGTSVRSATNSSDTAYVSMQGTSMAGPHVAGATALVLSAVPSLSGNVTGTESRLTGGAVRNYHLDLFVGRRAWFLGVSDRPGRHSWAHQVPVFDGSKICERKGRKVSRKSGSI